jgi:hypothetical protein
MPSTASDDVPMSGGTDEHSSSSFVQKNNSVDDLEVEVNRLADELKKKRFELGAKRIEEGMSKTTDLAGTTRNPLKMIHKQLSSSMLDSGRSFSAPHVDTPSRSHTPRNADPHAVDYSHSTDDPNIFQHTATAISSSSTAPCPETSDGNGWYNGNPGWYDGNLGSSLKSYDELEVAAHLEHLEEQIASKDAENELVRARLKTVETDWDEALFAKKLAEDELVELKERAVAKVKRVEEKWEKKLEVKEKELEELKYRLGGGFVGAGATVGGENGGPLSSVTSHPLRPSPPFSFLSVTLTLPSS